MIAYFWELLDRQGQFIGEGTNHENQAFTGTLSLEPILGKKGIAVRFRAEGKDGSVYHEEQSVMGPTLSENLALWVISNNHPAVVQHDFQRVESLSGGEGKTLIFGIGRPEQQAAFREDIAVDLYSNGDVGYRYFWGMPGGEFKERSGVRMMRC